MGIQARTVARPQAGPQHALIECPVFDVLFGGARGGGKTFGMLLDFGVHQKRYGQFAKGIFFRRELPQLEAAIEEARGLYGPMGATWKEQAKTFVFPSGAILRFRPLERDADAEKYQGHDYTRVYFEELTNYPDPRPVDKLKATLRSARGVPCRFRATANPGGPGHAWVKGRYIDAGPWVIVRDTVTSPFGGDAVEIDRVYIPSRLDDNPALLRSDPQYVARLHQVGSADLVRAWLAGDWDVVDGAFFDCWNQERHVLMPFTIPTGWTRFRSLDWGSARPFSVGWWAVAQDAWEARNVAGAPVRIPRGALIRYREWYGRAEPNVGLKRPAAQVATGWTDDDGRVVAGITAREAGERIDYGVADPAIFASDGGPSVAEQMAAHGIYWQRADNARVPRAGALGGWDQLRARLIGEDGTPMMYCFSTCRDSIRTIPSLPHDPRRVEDVDTSAEDHAADEWRYAAMSRPYMSAAEQTAGARNVSGYVATGASLTESWL